MVQLMEGMDHSTVARGRLAVLSAHLSASFEKSSAGVLVPSSCSAAVEPPPYLKGSLILVDDRTGKKYRVEVSEEGTIKATDLKKVFKICRHFCLIDSLNVFVLILSNRWRIYVNLALVYCNFVCSWKND